MSDYVYESGMSTKRRRQRRTAITLILTLLLLFGAFWWAWSYIREDATSVASPTLTPTPGQCIDPKDVTINVFNGTSRAGLARSSADSLKAAGFTIGKVANWPDDTEVKSFAVLRFGPAAEGAGTAFAEHYGQPVKLRLIADMEGLTMDLVLGRKFDQWAEFPEEPACGPTPSATE